MNIEIDDSEVGKFVMKEIPTKKRTPTYRNRRVISDRFICFKCYPHKGCAAKIHLKVKDGVLVFRIRNSIMEGTHIHTCTKTRTTPTKTNMTHPQRSNPVDNNTLITVDNNTLITPKKLNHTPLPRPNRQLTAYETCLIYKLQNRHLELQRDIAALALNKRVINLEAKVKEQAIHMRNQRERTTTTTTTTEGPKHQQVRKTHELTTTTQTKSSPVITLKRNRRKLEELATTKSYKPLVNDKFLLVQIPLKKRKIEKNVCF